MKPIWQIDSDDVIALQGRDRDFAQFVNDLLIHQVKAARIPLAMLRLNLRTHLPDGGVDAAIDQLVPSADDLTGFLNVPTVWQFKAEPAGKVKPKKGKDQKQETALRQEIRKPEAAKLVANGYGYRFCIADELDPAKKKKWEDWLLEEAQKIKTDAQIPRVVSAHDLATWANHLPGVILPFRPYLGALSSLRKWGEEITSHTPHFVPIAAWQAGMETIRDHADLTKPCIRVLQTIQGEAGVGKTRCVYEALANQEENPALVIYTGNETEAEKIADLLANDDHFRAILVADECGVQFRVRLERRLQPHAGRLRVIAIDNSLQEEALGVGEIRLQRMTEREVDLILEKNFPELPMERRHAFARLSGGFVRLAEDLCANATLIPLEGHIGSVLNLFRDHYLRRRLPLEEEQSIIEAVALLPRVGYRSDIRQQLEGLCQAVGLKPDRVVEVAQRLKQAPGFIALGERYLYVTPRVIAQAAFHCAWKRWIQHDPERFFRERFPAELMDRFADQLRAYGTDEMREVFSRFFQDWTSRLTAADMADEATVLRLVRLVEVEPRGLLPRLRCLIEDTAIEELRNLHSRAANGWGARRQLVWLAEKLLHLPEFFADAERILLRLALAEAENYANNASGIWTQVFRPVLSRTPIPFANRIRLLEQRFQTCDATQLALCLMALDGPLTADVTAWGTLLSEPVVAGRVPPPDWRPESAPEARECWTLTVELLKRLARSRDLAVREGVLDVSIRHVPRLLRRGFLRDLVELLNRDSLSDARLAHLLQALDGFLDLYCEPEGPRVSAELETAVRDWRHRLVPESLHGRLVSVVGQDPWHLRTQVDDPGEGALIGLARDLLSQPTALDQELPWLCSEEARSAVLLGVSLGRLDAEATQLERILNAAAESMYPGVARGYIQGLVQNHPRQIERVNQLLDQWQATHPRTVFDLISAGLDCLRPVERLLAMVDAGHLPVEYLRGVRYTIGLRPLTVLETHAILDRLLDAAAASNERAALAGVHVLAHELHPPTWPVDPDLQAAPWLRPLLEQLLVAALPAVRQEAYYWMKLLEQLGKLDPEAAIRLAVQALTQESLDLAEQAECYLIAVAGQLPDMVMGTFGEGLLNPATGWRLAVHRLRDLVTALPTGVVTRWLDVHGRPAAYALARHLPPPHLDASNQPVVPELTAYVLERFADDERVFREFCDGVHSLQVYEGDIATQHEQDGRIARRFLGHPLPRVRDWAQYEIDRSNSMASWWRVRDEEEELALR